MLLSVHLIKLESIHFLHLDSRTTKTTKCGIVFNFCQLLFLPNLLLSFTHLVKSGISIWLHLRPVCFNWLLWNYSHRACITCMKQPEWGQPGEMFSLCCPLTSTEAVARKNMLAQSFYIKESYQSSTIWTWTTTNPHHWYERSLHTWQHGKRCIFTCY